MARTHVGLIGAGTIARDHAKCLRLNRNVGRLSVFDVDRARAAGLAKDFDAEARSSQADLIDVCGIVWVCTPPALHRSAVAAAVKAGKPVFCEKPLAHTLADARAIARLAAKADVPCFMGQSGRYNKVFDRIRSLAADGTIGKPTLVWSARTGYLDAKQHPAWRLDDESSGGVIVELGVHEIDFIRWVGGDWRTVAATASAKTLRPGRYHDTFSAVGRLSSGANAQMVVSFAHPRYLWQRGVLGTEGELLFDDSRFPEILLSRPGRKPRVIKSDDWVHPDTGENMAFRDQAAAVLKALARGGRPPVSFAEGLAAVEVAIAARQSAKTGRTVNLKRGS